MQMRQVMDLMQGQGCRLVLACAGNPSCSSQMPAQVMRHGGAGHCCLSACPCAWRVLQLSRHSWIRYMSALVVRWGIGTHTLV